MGGSPAAGSALRISCVELSWLADDESFLEGVGGVKDDLLNGGDPDASGDAADYLAFADGGRRLDVGVELATDDDRLVPEKLSGGGRLGRAGRPHAPKSPSHRANGEAIEQYGMSQPCHVDRLAAVHGPVGKLALCGILQI
ncbi:hypothetical protein NicSoilE8_40800 (plasmid) [Arthrobacter sp. NicSoilE8]|nr:hypothetical protein NicSoilE8_40800 [Arthrobacter sp. NicSoilE8]